AGELQWGAAPRQPRRGAAADVPAEANQQPGVPLPTVRLTGELTKTVAGFGFTGKTLASTNAVIPIVYYLFRRGNPKGFDVAAAHQTDRATIQRWLNIVLLKQTFGGVPDNVLRRMREVIRDAQGGFPAEGIAAALEPTPYAL